jgi:rRNA processing protein Krr1/Pno1
MNLIVCFPRKIHILGSSQNIKIARTAICNLILGKYTCVKATFQHLVHSMLKGLWCCSCQSKRLSSLSLLLRLSLWTSGVTGGQPPLQSPQKPFSQKV